MTLLVLLASLWAYRTRLEIWARAPEGIRTREEAIAIVSEAGGKVAAVYAREGMKVRLGDPLVQLDTSGLALRKQMLESRIHFTELRQSAAEDRLERAELTSLYGQLNELNKEIGNLTVTSPGDGRITILAPLGSGDVVSRGAAIGVVVSDSRSPD